MDSTGRRNFLKSPAKGTLAIGLGLSALLKSALLGTAASARAQAMSAGVFFDEFFTGNLSIPGNNFPGNNMALFASVGVVGGSGHDVGMPRINELTVSDSEQFHRSVETMLAWDFDRVVVGHGEVIETDGKARLTEALRAAGF